MITRKGTIFYIHGNSSSSRVFHNIIHSKKIKYSQIAYDLPGHGNHQVLNKSLGFTTKEYGDFLLAKIKEIDDDILLVGNSLGGHIALEIAKKVKRLKGLLIFGTPPLKKPINIEEAYLPVPALQTFLTENPETDEIKEAFSAIIFDEKNVVSFVEDFKRANPKVRSTLVTDLQEAQWIDQESVFMELKIPKFIIEGSHDVSVNPNYLKTINNKCNGECELILYNECGHYASVEKPLEFEKTIEYVANKVFNP